MKSKKFSSNLLLCSLGFIGLVLFNDSLVTTSALEHLITLSLGSLFLLISFSVLYFRATYSKPPIMVKTLVIWDDAGIWMDSRKVKPFQFKKKPVLKILDWVLVCFVVLMMPCFEALGFNPIFWVGIIFIPSLCVRLFIAWYVRSWREK